MPKVTKSKSVKKKRIREYRKKKYPAEKLHVCNECGKKFYWQCKLVHHQLVHTGEKPFVCSDCGKGFNTSFSLKNHRYIHTNEKPFKCSFCSYACRDNSTLRKHQYKHMGIEKNYQCKMCDKAYKDKWRLKIHVAETHLQLDVRTVPCTKCDKMFKSKSELTVHIKTVHDKKKACKCPICDRRLTNSANLPQHLMTHVDAKPYRCTFAGCEKRYKDTSSLRKHALIHYPELHHPCEACGKLFARLERLERHWRTIHCKKKRVQCDYCKRRFFSKNYLINHIAKKHSKKRKRFKCDDCGFVTSNKPSIVMHIKHGHVSENDRECSICHSLFKRHAYLKNHYARTHGIVYKTKKRPPPLEIKDEPPDNISIDLFEIEKEELIEESNMDTKDSQPGDEVENTENEKSIKFLPDDMLKDFYVNQTVKLKFEEKETPEQTKYTENLDIETQVAAKKSIAKMLEEARQKHAVEAMEKARQVYNERMKVLLEKNVKKKPIKVKFFNNNKRINTCNSDESDRGNDERVLRDNEGASRDKESSSRDNEGALSDNEEVTRDNEGVTRDNEGALSDNQGVTRDNEKASRDNEGASNENQRASSDNSNESLDENDPDYSEMETYDKNTNPKINKVKFNTHQCYICFKLFPTKENLIDHCKDHFDVCTEKSLKKCPLCDYVTKINITRHMKYVHGVQIKIPYGRMKDKYDNTNGSRYYFEIDNPAVNKMEVIPSVRNLNKLASLKIDKKNRDDKLNTVAKTKLVRKGKEWIVERERVNFDNDLIMPEIDKDIAKTVKVSDSDSYFDSLKKLYHVAKKSGKKILFPCQNCDKICQNLAALKLHSRKHDSNAKPFRPKVWKHKQKPVKLSKPVETPITVKNTENRTAEPKPIKNKHKCDPELQEFYKKNIRGGDIEFWQFLKIYNRMDREQVNNFEDLEERYDFGIGHNFFEVENGITDDTQTTLNTPNATKPELNPNNPTKIVAPKFNLKSKIKQNCSKTKDKGKIKNYKRVIRISKEEHAKRNIAKNMLRAKIAEKPSSN